MYAKPVFQWAKGAGGRIAVDAQTVGERLAKLGVKHDGSLTRDIVLSDAQNPKSPLHACFEWDDKVAANTYRLEQAGWLIRNIEVTYTTDNDDEPKSIRAFVQVVREEDQKPVFVSAQMAFADPMLREQVLTKAHKELVAWRQRYAQYKELSDIFDSIDNFALVVTE